MAAGAQLRKRVAMAFAAQTLAERFAIPVESQRAEVSERRPFVLDVRALRVEILDPQVKPALLRARKEPGEQRGAQVSEVERSARAGGVATIGLAHSAEHGTRKTRHRYSRSRCGAAGESSGVCGAGVSQLDPEGLPAHVDRLFRAAWALCGSRVDAEDLVQETFARVLSGPRVLRGRDELAYLLAALRNTYVSDRRRAARRPALIAKPIEDLPLVTTDAALVPEPAFEASEVLAAIAQLPEDFRLALIAVDIVGLSYAEAARALGTREATITTRIYRARQQVSRRLEPDRVGKSDG